MSRAVRSYGRGRELARVGVVAPSNDTASPGHTHIVAGAVGATVGAIAAMVLTASKPIVLVMGAAGALLGYKIAADVETGKAALT